MVHTKDDSSTVPTSTTGMSIVSSGSLSKLTRPQLLALCGERGIQHVSGKKKADLIAILQTAIAASSTTFPTAAPTAGPIKEGDAFTFIDLFCGIGGFHQALKSLGGTCVLACDIDAKCRAVYKTNYGIEPYPDVTKLDTATMPNFDVLCGGFPCQAFSHAGKQEGFADIRGTLFRDVVRILEDKQPRYFLLENVKNLRGHDEGRTWNTIYASLCKAGYVTYERPMVMSPHHFGVPQHRERVLIVGIRTDLMGGRLLPPPPVFTVQPTDIRTILLEDGDPQITDSTRLSTEDITLLNKWNEFVLHFKARGVKLPTFPLWSADWDSTGSLSAYPAWKASFIQHNRDFYAAHRDFLAGWLKSARALPGFSAARAKLEWHSGAFEPADSLWTLIFQIRPSGIRVKRANYSPALVAMAQISIIGSKKRKLCPREVARLQSFPDSFILPASAGEAYKQFGNSVNVEVIRQAARIMFGLSDPVSSED